MTSVRIFAGGARMSAALIALLLLCSCNELIARVFHVPMLDRTMLEKTFDEDFDAPLSIWHAKSNPAGRWKTNYYHSVQDINTPEGWKSRTLAPNGEAQFYGDPLIGMDPFVWRKGELMITGKRNPYVADARTNHLPYLSGLITTEKSFSQTYGYFEARVALPKMGKGLWPAFWLLPKPLMVNGWAQGVGQQEIDVFESIGEPGTLYFGSFYEKNGGKVLDDEGRNYFTSADLTQYHTYGLLLTEHEIVWYVDDREVRRRPNIDFHMPAYLLLNLAIGGTWPGMPADTTPFPAQMRIAWVRAYKLRKEAP